MFNVQGSAKEEGFNKNTIRDALKNNINQHWADAFDDQGISLAYQYGGTTYVSMADAYLAAAEVTYSYQKSALSDAIKVSSPEEIPDGDMYNMWYSASVPGVGKRVNVILNQIIPLSDFLSFNGSISKTDTTVTVNEDKETVSKDIKVIYEIKNEKTK